MKQNYSPVLDNTSRNAHSLSHLPYSFFAPFSCVREAEGRRHLQQFARVLPGFWMVPLQGSVVLCTAEMRIGLS